MQNGFLPLLRRLLTGRMALDDVWLLAMPFAQFLILGWVHIDPADFWWHLRTGQVIIATGSIPAVDIFTFTRSGQAWTNQAWLSQTVFNLLYQLGQLPLIILFYMIVISAGYLFLEFACLSASRNRVKPAVLATLVSMFVGAFGWGVRPQAVSFLFLAVTIWIIEAHRSRGGRVLWALPPLYALWGNLHGGFVFGVGLIGLYVLDRSLQDVASTRALSHESKRALVAGVFTVLALAISPGGPLGNAQYVLGFLRSEPTLNLNREFMPLSIREPAGQLFFALVIGLGFLGYRRRVCLPGDRVVALLLFGVATLYSQRILPWFAMIAAPTLACMLGNNPTWVPPSPLRIGRPAANYGIVGLLALASLFCLPWTRPHSPMPPSWRSYVVQSETPEEAATRLCQTAADKTVFNDMVYGSYLEWKCPELKVFIDTRFELYPKAMWCHYLLVSNAQFGWEDIIGEYGIDTLFISKQRQSLLLAATRASAGWELVYEDENAAILHRSPG